MLHCSIEPKHQAAKPTGTSHQRDNTKPGGPLTHPPITEVKKRINPQPEQASVHMFYLLAEGSISVKPVSRKKKWSAWLKDFFGELVFACCVCN